MKLVSDAYYRMKALLELFFKIKKAIKPGCPNCGSKNWSIENIASCAYVPYANCKDCGQRGMVDIGSKYDKKEYGGMF